MHPCPAFRPGVCLLVLILALAVCGTLGDDDASAFTSRWLRAASDVTSTLLSDTARQLKRTAQAASDGVQSAFGESCRPSFDQRRFRANLTADLFGQHIVVDVLSRALAAHQSHTSEKPLVLSLHGQTGTGKTFVSERLAAHWFERGMQSKHFHHFVGRQSFPLVSETARYQQEIAAIVRSAVQNCDRAMFVFDETDKMPPGLLEPVTSVLGHHRSVAGVDFRRAVFVFVSNTHGAEIASIVHDWQLAGGLREELRPVRFEGALKLIAFNADGALKRSPIVAEDLIDHYVPFLPLERGHVKQCIRRMFTNHGVETPDELLVEQIATDSATYDDAFSLSGCKRIDKAVAYHAIALRGDL